MSEPDCPIPPKDYPDILRAFSDLLVEHGHDAEAGTLRAIADGVARLVRGPMLVWPEDDPAGSPFVVDSFHLERDQIDVSNLADGMRIIHMGDTLRITARRQASTQS